MPHQVTPQPTDTAVVWEMMEQLSVCMLVTHDGDDNRLRARPMAAQVRPETKTIFFLTDARTHKDDEIASDNHVCLTFSDSSNQIYVSCTGTAEISNNRQQISELWSMVAGAWWDSKDDPNIRVLSVTPTQAEFWDTPDLITTNAQSAAKALSGNRPNCGTNGKVTF
jgi:general stress protein 26